MRCGKKLSLEDCEIKNLKNAIETIEDMEGRKLVSEPLIVRVISVIEAFLRIKHVICYGGTAINNILPLEAQFYDRNSDIPDYDFFSPRAMEDAVLLANIYHTLGFNRVEAKAGIHYGTYKVFVNFIPIADITFVEPKLFKAIWEKSMKVDGIHYADPNYLRMAMYLELSRPRGDISRWEKVYKRLVLLNRYFPLEATQGCSNLKIQELIKFPKDVRPSALSKVSQAELNANIHRILKEIIIEQGLVLFGAYADSLYKQEFDELNELNKNKKSPELINIPDFDVLSMSTTATADIVKEKLEAVGYEKIHIKHYDAIGEIIAPHIRISIGEHPILTIYEPLACHSYNELKIEGQTIRIASIDTIMSFYLAFLYAKRKYYDPARILCICAMLFEIQQNRHGDEEGILRRFSTECYGEQQRFSDLLAEKQTMFMQLRGDTKSTEFLRWFLKYNPSEHLPAVDLEDVALASADIMGTIREMIAKDKKETKTKEEEEKKKAVQNRTLKTKKPKIIPQTRKISKIKSSKSDLTEKETNLTELGDSVRTATPFFQNIVPPSTQKGGYISRKHRRQRVHRFTRRKRI